MKGAWEYLEQRSGEDWLIGQERHAFLNLASQAIAELHQTKARSPYPPVIFLDESDPIHFLAKFIAACTTNCHLFLCNPTWTASEWAQAHALIQPDLIYQKSFSTRNSQFTISPRSTLRERNSQFAIPLICIPTGGSSGTIRFAMYTWETLLASVAGFQKYFGVERVHSCCVLPLYHVSGLMQFVRSLTSGGKFALIPYKTLESSQLPFDPADFFLSLVPTQLQRLLHASDLFTPPPLHSTTPLPHHPSTPPPLYPTTPPPSSASSLVRFKTILLGGAPAGSEFLEQARRLNIPLAPTYGMTETASQVATLKPADFLQGMTSCGQALPHAQITIRSVATGEVLGENQTGVVTIAAQSLALGYYPKLFGDSTFSTDDLGWLDERGYLHIVGRRSDKIITGGENVFPAEVEAAILATGLVQDVGVIGVSDRHWGEAIAAIYVPTAANLTVATLKSALENRLSKFKLPKHWIAVEQLPRNAQGKLNRQELRRLVPHTDLAKPATLPIIPVEFEFGH
ncbi:2-succinylbenzoate--CoA ligase [Leptolyngbyaceae cyanobacterium UHCC 1019]